MTNAEQQVQAEERIAQLRAQVEPKQRRFEDELASGKVVHELVGLKSSRDGILAQIDIEQSRLNGLKRAKERAEARTPEVIAAMPSALESERVAAEAAAQARATVTRLEAELEEAYRAVERTKNDHGTTIHRASSLTAELTNLQETYPELFAEAPRRGK
jgi:chromosome segregation ATPase